MRTIITGGNQGIGLATAEALAVRGHQVTIACRRLDAGKAAVESIQASHPAANVEARLLDLSNMASIRAFVEARDGPVDVLLNNAGTYRRRRETTADGFEMTFGVNHVGHAALTWGLLPKMPDGGRVVQVASNAHKWGRIRFGDLQKDHRYIGWLAYADSKLANILFARELARREPRIRANALHPGVSVTGIFREAPGFVRRSLDRRTGDAASIAKTSIHLASSPAVADATGGFWHGGQPTKPSRRAQDDAMAARLWEVTRDLVAGTADGRSLL